MPVARIGESVSYSDKLKEQAQLINKRRQQNLNVEIAQEEKNRQFRDQQLQTFYDFDVSGMSAEHIKAIGKLQANMANSLDPNSEDHYQNTQQLIADISFLNNAYNVASRHRDQRQSGTQQMVGLMTGEVEANPGEEFVNEGIDGLNNANALWDQGGFSGEINVGGSAGNRSMSGVPLVPNPDGGWMEGQGEVSFFENSLTNDSSPLYRPTIIASAPTLNKMAESAMSDEVLNGTNTEEVANLRWSTMDDSKKQRIAKEEYDRLAREGETTAFEDLTDKQKKDMGIDDESLRNKYRDKLQEGIDARGTAPGADAFDFNKSISNMPVLNEPIQIKTENEEYTGIGKVEGAQYVKGLDLDSLPVRGAQGQPRIPIEVAFVKNGLITKRTIDPATDPEEYSDFMESLGSRGREQLLAYSGYYQEPGGPEVEVGNNEPGTSNRMVTNAAGEDIVRGILGIDPENAVATPNAKIESDRQLLLDDIADAEEELKLQMSIAGGNAGNLTGRMEAMERLVELQEKLGPMNDALEALGIERIEPEPIDVPTADAEGADPDSSTAQADPVATDTGSAESRPLQTDPGGVYTSAQLEQNLESWEKELLAGTRPGQTVKSGVAVKAKNFGNLRPNNSNPYQSGAYQVSEGNEYQNFASYDEGLKGLIWDIKSKQHLDGLKSSAVGKNANITDVIMKYAPPEDNNNPVGYTDHIVNFVNESLGLTGNEAFTSKSKASDFPTELLVEAIISKEDVSLYREMKERGYFEQGKISGIVGNINIDTTRELRSRA